MRVIRGLLRSNMTQFLKAFHQRVIPRDRFNPSIGINKVGAAIADMSNRNLLAKHECGSQGGSAPRSFSLDGALGLAYSCLHDLLKRFVHCVRFDMEEIRMKLAEHIPGHSTDRRIACHFSELVSTHAVRDNVKTKWQIP